MFMIQVSYISSATRTMSTQELQDLLQDCRENNARLGITGMLLYGNQTFVQILEGEEQTVNTLLETIKRDPRHTNVRLLQRKPIERREYSDWSMGFKRVSGEDFKNVEGLNNFFEKDFNPTYLAGHASVVDLLMNNFRKERVKSIGQAELSLDQEDPFIQFLHHTIRGALRVVAVLMVFTILWGVLDVIFVIYQKLILPSVEQLTVRDIVATFGAFLAVLIAIEIFLNITLYIRKDVIHVKLVVATALMAIARKVIIFDFKEITPPYVLATGVVVLALGITYWLIERRLTWGEGDKF